MDRLIVVAGASGSGKTSLGNVLKEYLLLRHVTSFTTRPKRIDDVDANILHITEEEMKSKIAEGSIVSPNEGLYKYSYGYSDEQHYNSNEYALAIWRATSNHSQNAMVCSLWAKKTALIWLDVSERQGLDRLHFRDGEISVTRGWDLREQDEIREFHKKLGFHVVSTDNKTITQVALEVIHYLGEINFLYSHKG